MSPKTPPIPPNAPRRVEILAFPAVQLLDVAGPLQVFTAANEQLAARGAPGAYDVHLVAASTGIVATAGLRFATEALPPAGTGVDTLVVAGGQGVLRAAADAGLAEWVRDRSAQARRTASVCTGAFMLGSAGLLDGRRAVTHWEYCGELQRRFPLVAVDPDPIFVRDGPIWTSAGVTAGIDLALALVEEDLGRSLALAVARHLVVFLKRSGGQTQFSAVLTLQASDERFAELHAWIEDHLADDLSLARLAAQVGMSERSFGRRYREHTGLTPSRAVERLRVEAARQLLVDTQLPVKRVAARCGFGSEETMRRAFVRAQSVGPKEFRDRFA
ncbi:GlxA family transcriptional regulator [Methylobacterium crusticola]|nr:GlxA family transcriptional regulator [Methylobacterium crusticola]